MKVKEKIRHLKLLIEFVFGKEEKQNAYDAVKSIINGTLFDICVRTSYPIQRKIEEALNEAYQKGLAHGYITGYNNKS